MFAAQRHDEMRDFSQIGISQVLPARAKPYSLLRSTTVRQFIAADSRNTHHVRFTEGLDQSYNINKTKIKNNLFAIALFATLVSTATAAQNRYHDEESGKSYIVPTRPLTVIESQDIYKALDKGVVLPVEFKAPTHWSVRAIYVRTNSQLLEFSKSGEIVYDSTDPDGRHQTDTYAMRQIFVRGKPVWKNAHVFQRVSSSAERDINYGLALIPLGLVYSNNGNVCPVRDIDPILHQRPSPRGAPRYTLDGTCSGVIRKKISGREFLTYPGFERISDPYFFWSIQYFSDPVKPMYSESGECLRYCDEETRKQEALFRKIDSTH
ncbi:hypothetical protein [Ralstonia insidiosa]|uniref:hypothetical protein n=1 Tax=Ralstonia insidiosa TaxID=190721 RepID=UPI001427BF53|nr:hypothetical protein [Ralstonia insidiosa]